MALYELKTGNGGHGLEPFNTVTGKYEKVSFDFEGQKIDGWEGLRDLMLDVSQQQIYSGANDDFKKQVDDYIKEQYSKLLEHEVNRLNKDYEIKNLKRFDTVDDFINNIESVITPQLCNDLSDIFTQKGSKYTLEGRLVSSFAVVLQKNRFPLSMVEVSKEEYEKNVKNVPPFDYNYEKIGDYVKNNDIIPVYRNLKSYNMNKNLESLKNQFLNSKTDKYDTMLGRCSGNLGSVIYMSPDTNRINGLFRGDIQIKGYVEKRKAKILELNNETKSNSLNPLIQSFKEKRNDIVAKTRSLLIQNGVSGDNVNRICDSLLESLGHSKDYYDDDYPDIGVIAMLMGYDAVTGNKYEFDILNPSIVNLRGDF